MQPMGPEHGELYYSSSLTHKKNSSPPALAMPRLSGTLFGQVALLYVAAGSGFQQQGPTVAASHSTLFLLCSKE